jgi:hypothetical protein
MANKLIRCPGSGQLVLLSWFPDKSGYPGAVVCECSYGVLVRKGSVREATSQAGHQGDAGIVRVHYVSRDLQKMSYKKPA